MIKSILSILLVFLSFSIVAQTWSKKLEWQQGGVYMHADSAVGVKDAAVLLNGNICALAQIDQSEVTKLFVLDSASHQILWTKDLGQWGALASQFTPAIATTSDTSVLVCLNWYGQAADIHVTGMIYKYSASGIVQWVDTFIAAPYQMRTAADIIEISTGDYLALVGDTVYQLDASTGTITNILPALVNPSAMLGNCMAIHAVPGSTDYIVNSQNSTARFDLSGNTIWSFNHTQLEFTMHSAITPNAFYLLLNDTLHTIDFSTGAINNTTILPASYYSSLNAAANGNLFASQGQKIHEFSSAFVQSGGLVQISPAGNILAIKSIPLPLCGVSWVSELPGGMLFCGGGYRLTTIGNPSVASIGNNYMPFCFTTDSAMNGIMDSTTYIWPGDANNNHILQFSDDAIYIQQSLGNSGVSRDTIHYFSPYNGLDHSDFLKDWNTTNTAGVNDKFGDVNGDGLIDINDLNAFNTIWFSLPIAVPYRTTLLPDVTFIPTTNIVAPGDTAKFYIVAGLTTPIDSVSGIAFSNMGYLSVAYNTVDFLPNTLGIPTTDTRTFCSPPFSMNFGNVVLSRIDRANRHLSNDTIGIISFIIPASYTDSTFSTSVVGIQGITGDGANVPLVAVNGTVTVSGTSSISTIQEKQISLFPNPANDKIQIGSQFAEQGVAIYNSIGKCVLSTSVSSNGSIDVSTFAEGVYYLKIVNENVGRKFVVGR